MLTDTIPRVNTDGSHNDIELLDGFLNPAAYYKNGNRTLELRPTLPAPSSWVCPTRSARRLDEFVVNTLRNNLLGLPLDLPAINMTRARSEGIPPLNDVRRQIFASTNDGQLKPYTDWIDFGEQLKHPESLVNFVAAYGTHPAVASATTLAASAPPPTGSSTARFCPARTASSGPTRRPPPTTPPPSPLRRIRWAVRHRLRHRHGNTGMRRRHRCSASGTRSRRHPRGQPGDCSR